MIGRVDDEPEAMDAVNNNHETVGLFKMLFA